MVLDRVTEAAVAFELLSSSVIVVARYWQAAFRLLSATAWSAICAVCRSTCCMRLSKSVRRLCTTAVSCMADVLGAVGEQSKQARQTNQIKTIQMSWDAMHSKLYSSMYIMHFCGGIQPGKVKGTARREAGKRNSQQAAQPLTPQ